MTLRFAGVRYQVKDVDRSVSFYTERLGFKVERRPSPVIALLSLEKLTLWLSGPGSSGSKPMPDNRTQEPGGWNRIALEVDDLPAEVATLKKAGVRFRNEIVSGPGGNPIELFKPAAH